MNEQEGFRRAIAIVGGQRAMARVLGTSQAHIHYWLAKAVKGVPAERVAAIVEATGGKVRKWELRPDLFPPPASRKRKS